MGTDDAAVAQALAEAVRRVGPELGTQPRRVRAMLTDVLGPRARDHRAEVEALVSAAEHGVPHDLAAGRGDPAKLWAAGIDADLARFAAEAWGYALGHTAPGAVPPTLAATRPGSGSAISRGQPVAAEPTVMPYWTPGGPPHPGRGRTDPHNTDYRHTSDYPDRRDSSGGRSRKPLWLGLTAAAAAVAVIVLVAVFAIQDLRNRPETGAAPQPVTTSTTPPVTSAPSSTPPTTPSPQVTSVVPPAQPAPRSPQAQPAPRTQSPPVQPAANRAPVKQSDPTFVAKKTCSGSLEVFYIDVLDPFFSDPDGDELKITSASASAGTAQIGPYAGRPYTILWTEPTVGAYGNDYVNFTVADSRGGTSSGVLTITVPPNQC